MEVRSSDNETDVSVLRTSLEEADTGLILHCHRIRCHTAAALATCYADILLLLSAHSPSIPSPNLLMMSGTPKKKTYFNIKAITALVPFHALTGYGTTSFFPPQPFEDVGIEGFLLEV